MIYGITEVCGQSRGLLGIMSSVGAISLELLLYQVKETFPQFSIIFRAPAMCPNPVLSINRNMDTEAAENSLHGQQNE